MKKPAAKRPLTNQPMAKKAMKKPAASGVEAGAKQGAKKPAAKEKSSEIYLDSNAREYHEKADAAHEGVVVKDWNAKFSTPVGKETKPPGSPFNS